MRGGKGPNDRLEGELSNSASSVVRTHDSQRAGAEAFAEKTAPDGKKHTWFLSGRGKSSAKFEKIQKLF